MTYLEAAFSGEWPLKPKPERHKTRLANLLSEIPEKSVDENDAEDINEA